jgi:hypothetical protein
MKSLKFDKVSFIARSTPKSTVNEAIEQSSNKIGKNLKIDFMSQKEFSDYDGILNLIVNSLEDPTDRFQNRFQESAKPEKLTILLDQIINRYKEKLRREITDIERNYN